MKDTRIVCILLAFIMLFPLITSCASNIAVTETENNTSQTETNTSQTETKTIDRETTEPEEETIEPDQGTVALVNAPSAMPNYALREGAYADEMRAMAIQAMRDQLSVKWSPVKDFEYHKDGPASERDYVFKRGTVYGGMPYTQGNSGLLQWLQYYNFETGVLSGCSFDHFNATLGNACTTCMLWGWYSVCTSVNAYQTSTLNYLHGCLPVGNYTYDFTKKTFDGYTTDLICKDNGQDVIFESYAAILPADAVFSFYSRENHVMMAIEPAHVEYTADGKIDGTKSTITIQDKGPWQYPRLEDGQTVNYIGRLKKVYTFQELYNVYYLPITTEEFLGYQPYVKGSVTYESEGAEPGTLESLYSGKLLSPHKICVIDVFVTDGNGTDVYSKKTLFSTDMIRDGSDVACPLSKLDLKWNLKGKLTAGKPYHARISVLTATGERFTPCDFDFTA